MSVFIVIEGMDGCGKSTITKLLANKINAIVYKTPPSELTSIRKHIDGCNEQYSKFFYYMACNFYASTQIQKNLGLGKSVVCDRYYYTTVSAYYDVLESLKLDFWKSIKVLTSKFFKPDFAFFLDISEEERKKRIMEREDVSLDDLESMDSSISHKNLEIYKKMDLITIDTNNLSTDQVVDMIIRYAMDMGQLTNFVNDKE